MDHSDVRGDVAEHVRVIGYAVQGGANRARTKIGDILCSQAWPPGRTSSQGNLKVLFDLFQIFRSKLILTYFGQG